MRRSLLSRPLGLLFLLPAFIFVAVFLIYPFISIFLMSFTNRTLVGAAAANPQYVGLQNYANLFDFSSWMRNGEFGASLLLSAQFVFGSALIGQTALGMLLAYVFHRRRGLLREIVFTLVITAWIIPDVVVAFAWFAYLNPSGTLNQFLGLFGVQSIDWLFNYPMLSIILFNTWRGTAFSMLLFSSALQSIPPSQLETADVIGANAWQTFRDILLPQLGRYILTDVLLITLWTFNSFTPYLITGGGPVNRTEIVSIYIYDTGLKFFQFGKASAIALVMMIINLLLEGFYLFVARSRKAI